MYKIEITETVIEDVICGKEWAIGAGDKNDIYGYTPEIIKKKPVTRTVLIQEISSLVLTDVIKAVNGIK